MVMKAATIRKKLIEEINNAPEKDLKDLYNLHSIIKEEKNNGFKWSDLTEYQKLKIQTGLQQLKNGEGVDAKLALTALGKKYGIF